MQLIGISGPARSGKDTFSNSLVEYFKTKNIRAKRMALADELKRETQKFLIDTLEIDPFTEINSEKEIIRPFLVFWGTEVRRKLNESVWIEKLQANAPKDSIIIVSDIRYLNEQQWIKDSGGFCIFVDRIVDGKHLEGANDYERQNNPILRQNCDYHLAWTTLMDKDDGAQAVDTVVDEVAANTFPPDVLEQWKQTYSLSKK